jgi:threonine/homoserine/homoserine lactone efflux protein
VNATEAAVALLLIIGGVTLTYIATGMARASERAKNLRDCDDQLTALRRQLTGRRGA